MEQALIDNKQNPAEKSRVRMVLFDKLAEIIGFFFIIIISNRLMDNPFFGGSVYISGQFAILCIPLFRKNHPLRILKKGKPKYRLLAFFAAGITLCILFFYPFLTSSKGIPFLLLFIGSHLAGYCIISGYQFTAGKIASNNKVYWLYSMMVSLTVLMLCIWRPAADIWWQVLIYYIVTLFIIFLARQFRVPEGDVMPICHAEAIDNMMQIHSVRLYWHMNMYLSVAFEVSVLVLVCYLPFLPFNGFWSFLFDVAILSGLVFVSSAASRFLITKRLRNFGNNSVFILFSVIWIGVNLYLYRHAANLGSIQLSVSFLLLCLCITALATVSLSMDRHMQVVGEIGLSDFSTYQYNISKQLIDRWGMLVSRFILIILAGAMTFIYELSPSEGIGKLAFLGKYGITLIPAAFLMFAVAAALKQPLTKYYEKKLKKYLHLKAEGKRSKPLETRLTQALVEKYKKKVGVKLIILILKPFFHHKHIGLKNIDPKKLPCVFVCNHSEIYGPVTAVINIPYLIRPWITSNMIDVQKVSEHIQKGVTLKKKWIPAFIQSKICDWIGPLVAWAMNSMDPIPVYKGEGRDILKGIELSVDALEIDDNILLFPEDPSKSGGHYLTEGVGGLFTGFVNIAKAYYKKTGKSITFYSIYANKKKRTLSFSEGTTFNPNRPFHDEKQRIADFLYTSMVEMSRR